MSCASTFVGFVDDAGHFALDDRESFLAALQRFKGLEVVLSVRRRPSRQGTQTMRYYRGVVIPDIAKAMGEIDPAEFDNIHNGLAWKFLRIEDGPLGEPRRRSTAKDDLTADEMSDYVSKVILFAETSIPGCHIRRPDEIDMLDETFAPEYAGAVR